MKSTLKSLCGWGVGGALTGGAAGNDVCDWLGKESSSLVVPSSDRKQKTWIQDARTK
jgi:hypothetical protein